MGLGLGTGTYIVLRTFWICITWLNNYQVITICTKKSGKKSNSTYFVGRVANDVAVNKHKCDLGPNGSAIIEDHVLDKLIEGLVVTKVTQFFQKSNERW